jgi:hypothetical protein
MIRGLASRRSARWSPERFGGFDRQDRVCCAGVDDPGELDGGTPLGLDDQVENGQVAVTGI